MDIVRLLTLVFVGVALGISIGTAIKASQERCDREAKERQEQLLKQLQQAERDVRREVRDAKWYCVETLLTALQGLESEIQSRSQSRPEAVQTDGQNQPS